LNPISIPIIFGLRPTKADAAEVRDIRERTIKKCYDRVSMTLITAPVAAPDNSTSPPLPALSE